ncbi:hypothetical protein DICSQDRAFT_128452 [Dichomitus squalens LYAD-421 SS1]|uniref:Uncharacterized protein n=1 Tax=Dichomitus squalens (strain LYAD-421) TaxID=732165 RepID=R7STE3_DICSQ|nr:uncharacterized protein DICSQDRAFT_128452 [Dichomitus squalens LYAD-421 SS1]EJF59168.1 hypothetical protein DICSQDRAFT_128452 [Dichomitus squalens LYAD-421 SS1]
MMTWLCSELPRGNVSVDSQSSHIDTAPVSHTKAVRLINYASRLRVKAGATAHCPRLVLGTLFKPMNAIMSASSEHTSLQGQRRFVIKTLFNPSNVTNFAEPASTPEPLNHPSRFYLSPRPGRRQADDASFKVFTLLLGAWLGVPQRAVSLPSMPPSAELPMLDDTFGAMLVGTFVGLILYGMVILQSFRYLRMYPEDGPWQKGWVLAIFLLETFHMVLCTHICYHYVITSYRTPGILLTFNCCYQSSRVLLSLYVRESFTMEAVSFFAWRIFLRFFTAATVDMCVSTCITWAAIVAVGEVHRTYPPESISSRSIAEIGPTILRLQWLISVATGIVIISDLLMTTMLVMILRNSRTGIKRMDLVIDVLTLYAINTVSDIPTKPHLRGIWNRRLQTLNARKSLRYTSAMLEDGLTIPLTPRGVAIPRTNTSTSSTFLVDSPYIVVARRLMVDFCPVMRVMRPQIRNENETVRLACRGIASRNRRAVLISAY